MTWVTGAPCRTEGTWGHSIGWFWSRIPVAVPNGAKCIGGNRGAYAARCAPPTCSPHYGFDYRFCNSASGNEKGNVETKEQAVRSNAYGKVIPEKGGCSKRCENLFLILPQKIQNRIISLSAFKSLCTI